MIDKERRKQKTLPGFPDHKSPPHIKAQVGFYTGFIFQLQAHELLFGDKKG
jgi:hypothetical protein